MFNEVQKEIFQLIYDDKWRTYKITTEGAQVVEDFLKARHYKT